MKFETDQDSLTSTRSHIPSFFSPHFSLKEGYRLAFRDRATRANQSKVAADIILCNDSTRSCISAFLEEISSSELFEQYDDQDNTHRASSSNSEFQEQ